jgi:hypothetical protein
MRSSRSMGWFFSEICMNTTLWNGCRALLIAAHSRLIADTVWRVAPKEPDSRPGRFGTWRLSWQRSGSTKSEKPLNIAAFVVASSASSPNKLRRPWIAMQLKSARSSRKHSRQFRSPKNSEVKAALPAPRHSNSSTKLRRLQTGDRTDAREKADAPSGEQPSVCGSNPAGLCHFE